MPTLKHAHSGPASNIAADASSDAKQLRLSFKHHAAKENSFDDEDGGGPCWWHTLPHEVRRQALATCKPDQWINNDVINASLEMLTSLYPNLRTLSTLELNTHIPDVSSTAFNRIMPTLRFRGQLNNKLDTDHVFDISQLVFMLSLHINRNHWVMAWVNLNSKVANIIDSLPTKSSFSETNDIIMNIVTKILGPGLASTTFGAAGADSNVADWSQWTCKSKTWIQQSNTYDCGVYAIAAAFYHAASAEPLPNSIDVGMWRHFLAGLLHAPAPYASALPTPVPLKPYQIFIKSVVPARNDSLPPRDDLTTPTQPTGLASVLDAIEFSRKIREHAISTYAARATARLKRHSTSQDFLENFLRPMLATAGASQTGASSKVGAVNGDSMPVDFPRNVSDRIKDCIRRLNADCHERGKLMSQLVTLLRYHSADNGSMQCTLQEEITEIRSLVRVLRSRLAVMETTWHTLTWVERGLQQAADELHENKLYYEGLCSQLE